MGYRAPSAENVYRYVFRLDHQSRSLTDGFGLSIVFVNDGSSVCRDFISRHFVDLCHRTADRIRIIFFSELPNSDFEYIARPGNLHEDGMLGAVIQSVGRSSRYGSHTQLLDGFLEALRFQDYPEADWLLTRISYIFGPRYADTLYRLVRKHRSGDAHEAETLAHALILKLRDRKRRSKRDPFRRMYDDHWRDLTPASLTPIDAPERTHELSFDVQMNAAMPGVGESMRFAARLGIGGHVPCFVFFSDVGELSVDIFPIGELNADETYRQLRIWIDRFYKENRATVDKWNQVERDIATFTKTVSQSLATLHRWIRDGDDLWRDLRSTAELIVQLSSALPEPEMYELVIARLNPSSWKCRPILLKCQSRLKELHAKKDKHEFKSQRFEVIINKLKNASYFREIYDSISFASDKPLTSPKFINLNEVLRRVRSIMVARMKIINAPDPESELFIWWRYMGWNLPSFRQFQRARKTWSFVTERDHEVAQSEYAALLDAVFALTFSDMPEVMTQKIRFKLASIIGIDPQSNEWDVAFSAYSNKLITFFQQISYNSPRWISNTATALKISDIIPFRSHDPADLKEILAATKEDDPLRHMIRKATVDWSNRQTEIVVESKKVALQCRDEVLAAFTELQKEPFDLSTDTELQEEPFDLSTERVAVYSACLRDVRAVRDRIEAKLTELANLSSDPDNPPCVVDARDIERFSSLLDEYDRTVNSLSSPYKSERRVQSIKLPAAVSQVLELRIPEQTTPSDRRRKELEKIARNSKSGPRLLHKIRNRSYSMTPIARVVDELKKIEYVPPSVEECLENLLSILQNFFIEKGRGTPTLSRQKTLLRELLGEQEHLVIAVTENLEETLNKLNDDDLYRVWNSLTESTAKAKSRKATVDMILAIAGAISAEEQSRNPTHESPRLRERVRLKELDTLTTIQFEKLHAMEIDLDISSSAEKRIEIKQRIRIHVIPRLREIEAEFCQIGLSVLRTLGDDYEIKRLLRKISQTLESSELSTDVTWPHDKEDTPIELLRRVLPQIAIMACEEVEPGRKKNVSSVWRSAKSLIFKASGTQKNV